MRLFLAAALVAISLPAAAQSAIPDADIINGAIDGYIRPAFHQLAEESGSLATNVTALCGTPSADALERARNQFRSTVVAYSRIEFIRIGPLTRDNRLERLLFWPDRKGIALRQVQEALATEDPTATNPATLVEKSVAMQGLSALEYLLFGTGSDDLAAVAGYRCDYAAASATTIATLAATLDTEWQDGSADGIAQHMLSPQPTYDDFRTTREVLEKLAATLVHGTETMRDQRITPIIGASGDTPKPRSALFWRSQMTAPSLAANFAGLHDFFLAARYPEAVGRTNEWVAKGAIFEFENAARAAAILVDPMDKAVKDDEQLQALRYMIVITGSLDHLLGENLSAALGLSFGFSALDGD